MTMLLFFKNTLAILSVLAGLHPLHVTVTDIEYDRKDQALEIMVRVFMDDYETNLREHFKQPDLDVLNPKGTTIDKLSEAFMKERLKISLDKKAQVLRYLGHEKDGDAFVFYIEVPNVKAWSAIEIQNSLLTDLYEDQSNLVHVTVGEQIKSLRLTRDTPAGILSF